MDPMYDSSIDPAQAATAYCASSEISVPSGSVRLSTFWSAACQGGKLYQGDISLADRFNLRSVTTDDVLTTYEISGADLKKLMEHPKIGGEEINATYALSGLKMEYAEFPL